MPALSPQEISFFDQRASTARNRAGRALAQNAFNVNSINQGGLLQREQIRSQYGPARGALARSAAGRGILNSGVYRRDLNRLRGDELNAYRGLELGLADRLGRVGLSNLDIEGQLADELESVERERLARQAYLASIIQEGLV